MPYLNTETKQYNLTEQQVREAFPNTSFPSVFVAPDPYVLVFPAPHPEHNPVIQSCREVTPVLTNKSHYEQAWEIIELYDTLAERDEAIAADAEAKRLASVPVSVSMRQARLALLAADLLDDVEAFITTLPRAAQIEWEFATDVRRDHAVIAVVQAQQGMTDIQIDDLFVAAGSL